MATNECDKRIVIIGAGSQSFGLGTLGDLMTIGQKLSGATVVLHDKSEEMLKLVGGVFGLALKQASEDGDPAPFKMEATTDPVKALQGADYVVMSIEHGNRLKTWEPQGGLELGRDALEHVDPLDDTEEDVWYPAHEDERQPPELEVDEEEPREEKVHEGADDRKNHVHDEHHVFWSTRSIRQVM